MQPGQLIAGEFMLQKLLSQGATGEIWRALEPNVGRLVRLHFVPLAFGVNQAAMDRFRRHFDVVRLFRHPHVTVPERLVESSDGGTFVVSRHVEGLFLNEYAAQWIRAEGKFPFNLIFEVLRPVASALDEAGGQLLVHRTLSPRQIVISQTEGIQLLDFDLPGIVREFMEAAQPQWMLDDRERLRYVAPEQLLGKTATPLSDEYSFAMIVAELLGNQLLFPATDVGELRQQVLTMQPPKLPNQPEHANIALQRALYKDPDFRFPSCIHFLDGLAGLIEVSLPPPTAFSRTATESNSAIPIVGTPVPVAQVVPTQEGEQNSAEESDSVESSDPDDSSMEGVASFQKIASAARSATANKVATQIRRERRFRVVFYAWNALVLLGCVVAFFLFRDHISKVWKQRSTDGETVQTRTNGQSGAEPQTKRRTWTVVERPSRRSRKEKEETFDDEGESPFASAGEKLGNDDSPDEVRFLGLSGKGKRILFVVDASAVMGGGKLSPWEHVQKELAFSFRDLNSSQKFQVVYYSDEPKLLDGGDDDSWLAVKPDVLKSSYETLKAITGAGTGNPAAALEKAISLKPDVIFFLTDRKSTVLTRREIDALKQNADGIPINAVEIGEGDEPQRNTPVRSLAQTCGGEYKWINANFHGLNR